MQEMGGALTWPVFWTPPRPKSYLLARRKHRPPLTSGALWLYLISGWWREFKYGWRWRNPNLKGSLGLWSCGLVSGRSSRSKKIWARWYFRGAYCHKWYKALRDASIKFLGTECITLFWAAEDKDDVFGYRIQLVGKLVTLFIIVRQSPQQSP